VKIECESTSNLGLGLDFENAPRFASVQVVAPVVLAHYTMPSRTKHKHFNDTFGMPDFFTTKEARRPVPT